MPKNKDRFKTRACNGKTRYKTKADAVVKGSEVYHCSFCKGWHRTGGILSAINQIVAVTIRDPGLAEKMNRADRYKRKKARKCDRREDDG